MMKTAKSSRNDQSVTLLVDPIKGISIISLRLDKQLKLQFWGVNQNLTLPQILKILSEKLGES